MTIHLVKQPDTIADKILAILGKRRAYSIPCDAEQSFGPYVYAMSRKESFWSALIRRRDAPLPDGLIPQDQMEDLLMENRTAFPDLTSIILNKKDVLLQMQDQCGKDEKTLAAKFFANLDATEQALALPGLFGQPKLNTDHLVSVGKDTFIAECKKATEGSEYSFWHGVIQSLLYRKQSPHHSVLCVVFDWGRMAGTPLPEPEREFLGRWSTEKIWFVRLSLSMNHFIEHNLSGEWEIYC